MDRETWTVLIEASRIAAGRMPKPSRKPVYPDLLVLRVWLWAGMHDRPLSWACSRENYNGRLFRPRKLPSISRLSRRVRSARFARLRAIFRSVMTGRAKGLPLSFIDGKALPVGEHSTDPDARDGVVTHTRFRKGYRLHARVNSAGFIEQYRVTPLNEGEARIARRLVRHVPRGGLVLADANYDSRHLYGATERRGAWLFTPVKGKARKARTFRRMPELRRQAVVLWRDNPETASELMNLRASIERRFGNMVSFGGGLCHLPAWVRQLHRVKLWVDAKIAVYHARLIARIAAAAAG